MKAVIIGCSIAGAISALAFAGNISVSVYEQKKKDEISGKACANVVTPSFLKYCNELGLNPWEFIVSDFTKAIFISMNNDLFMRTREFRIDRKKFLEVAVKNAQKKGAKFNFETEFVSFRKEKGQFIIRLRKGKKEIEEKADILIGADGALSKVAEQAGLWADRKMWLCIQTEIPARRMKSKFDRDSYYIFLERRFGYYSYIFPYKDKVIIGTGDKINKAEPKFNEFMKFLKVKPDKIQAALIPFPKKIHFKKNLFLAGDAACSAKFSGGGIVPAIMDAIAIRNIVIKKDLRHYKVSKKRVSMNRIVSKAFSKMSDKDFDKLLEILKDDKFSDVVQKRDEFEKTEYLKMFDTRFLRFIPLLF